MDKHEKLLKEKFPHAEEDLLVNQNGKENWSLFRTKSGGVTIYYHNSDDFYIVNPKKAQHYSLKEIAESWEPVTNTMVAIN
jgi:hypothetical protein